MRLPSPSYREYVEFVATVLVTVAGIQYLGVFGPPGGLNVPYLAILGLTLPVVTSLLTVAGANVDRVPRWDRMIRDER